MENILLSILLGAMALFVLAGAFGIIVISLDTLEQYKKDKKRNRL